MYDEGAAQEEVLEPEGGRHAAVVEQEAEAAVGLKANLRRWN